MRGFRFEGHVHFRGQVIYAPRIDPVLVHRYIGMVFQQPNPFAMSIFNNVAFGPRLNRYKGNVCEKIEPHGGSGLATLLNTPVPENLRVFFPDPDG